MADEERQDLDFRNPDGTVPSDFVPEVIDVGDPVARIGVPKVSSIEPDPVPESEPDDEEPADDELDEPADADRQAALELASKPPPAGDAVADPNWTNGKAKYDWPVIKRRYVEGVYDQPRGVHLWPTLNEVAEHFGATPQRVRERSSNEGWVAARTRWQTQVETTRQANRANALSKSGVQLDDRALEASQLGLQLCYVAMQETALAANARRERTVEDGKTATSGIDPQHMQRLAAAVDLFHKIGLRAVGDPETTRLEITGANGRPIEISQELKRDDPNRLTGVLGVLHAAGFGDLFGGLPVAQGPAVIESRVDGEPS